MSRKIILLELNEVPYRVIDGYCTRKPNSRLQSVLTNSRQYVSFTEDELALDPWISWPTLHRGVNDKLHNILHLGQVIEDSDAAFPPIWRLLKERGLSVGVFGSLHSSNRPEDVSQYSFYLPDYFDSEVVAFPPALSPFQQLNLSMTRESARNVTRSIPARAALRFALRAPSLGLKITTAFSLVAHLLHEVLDASVRIRRRVYQPVVMMDLFLKQLTRAQPDFASFYTNHVAAAMHRYWGAAFPEDYGDEPLDAQWVKRYKNEIWFAMEKLDRMLGQLCDFVDRNTDYTLVIASSMGQAAIPAKKTYDFLTVVNVSKFLNTLGVPDGEWEIRPAMVPCFSIVINPLFVASFLQGIQTLSIGGATIVRDNRPIGPMSFDQREGGSFQFFVQFDSYTGVETASVGGQEFDFSELGLGRMVHEDGVNCTAQHTRDGSLIVYPAASKASAVRSRVSTLDLVPSILAFMGIERPSYMRGLDSINLERPIV